MISEMEKKLPPLKHFIIPGGSNLAARLHLARTIARRAEREMIALNKKKRVKPQVLEYFNCLSDYFFILARDANYQMMVDEDVWMGGKK